MMLGGLGAFYFITAYGRTTGIYLACLTWSLYVLGIPAAHGQYCLGFPLFYLFRVSIYTEPLFWIMALVFNVVTYVTRPTLYLKSFFPHFLQRMLITPYPYWFLIGVAACGTMYNFLVGEYYFKRQSFKHAFIRSMLILLGILSFFYFSYQDMIILLNAVA